MAIINVSPGTDVLKTALESASNGDEFHLSAGVYDFTSPTAIILPAGISDIKIIGPNADINPNTDTRVAEAIIQDAEIRSSVSPSDVQNNIEINGVKFTGAYPAGAQVRLYGNNSESLDLTIKCNIFYPSDGGMLQLSGQVYATTVGIMVEDNLFDGELTKGTSYDSNINLFNCEEVTIQNNVSVDSDYAFLQTDSSRNVVVDGNHISNADRKGIQVGYWYGPSDTVLIQNNTIVNCNTEEDPEHGGIVLYGDTGLKDIVIINNTIQDTWNSFSLHDDDFGDASYYTIKDNTVIDSRNADILNNGTTGSIYFDRNWWQNEDKTPLIVDGPDTPIGLVVTYWEFVEVTNTKQLPSGLTIDSAYGVQRNGTLHAGGGLPFVASNSEEGKDKRPMVIVSSAGGATPTQAARGGLGAGSHSTFVTYRKP